MTKFENLPKNHKTNSTKLGTKNFLVKGCQVNSNEEPCPFAMATGPFG